MSRVRDERGMVGKLLVLWLVVLALVVVAAIDGGAILLARIRTADLARDAAAIGARVFERTGERREALRAARAVVAEGDDDATIDVFEITQRGEVTVVVVDLAGTVLAGLIGPLDDLTRVESSGTSSG